MEPLRIRCSTNEREQREQLAEATRAAAQGRGVIWESAQGKVWARYLPETGVWIDFKREPCATIYEACGFEVLEMVPGVATTVDVRQCGHPAVCFQRGECGWCRALAERDEAVARRERPMTAVEKRLSEACNRMHAAARKYAEVYRDAGCETEPQCGHPAGCWIKETDTDESHCGWCLALAERDEFERKFNEAVAQVRERAVVIRGGSVELAGPICWLFVEGGTVAVKADERQDGDASGADA